MQGATELGREERVSGAVEGALTGRVREDQHTIRCEEGSEDRLAR